MRETWYVLEDGSVADPSAVAPDAAGVLHHKDGRKVAMRGEVPSTRGVDADEQRAKHSNREVTADKPKRTYRTRDS